VSLLPVLAHRRTARALPLDVLVEAMCDEAHPIELRLAAAKAAAPYFHARISPDHS
jgi:hypothetical protein